MFDFTFHNPTKIIFGRGSIGAIDREVPSDARVMLIYGSESAKRYGVLEEVRVALCNREILEFGGIEANPEFDTIVRGANDARQFRVDYLVAIGGGSVIDATKFMAAVIAFDGDPALLLENKGADIHAALPVGAVVTLPASASEMNNRAVISRRALKLKQAIMSPHLFPRFAALDPEKTYSLPLRYIGNGVVDTFVHVLEQYMTYPVGGHVQDRLAEALLLLLVDQGPKALAHPYDYDVRANLMWAATLGLNGLIGAGVPQDWAAHRAGYELTALYGLDHAQTLAVLVPAMLTVRSEAKKEKLLQYAKRVWHVDEGDQQARVAAAIQKTRDFFEMMGVPTRLGAYGIDISGIEHILRGCETHGMVALGEKMDVTPDVMRRILGISL